MKKMSAVKKSIITAVCIALCVVLPQVFHAIPEAGTSYCPMHITVVLWGRVRGCCAVWQVRCSPRSSPACLPPRSSPR